MIIKELVVGPIASNCYILGCESTKNAVVIDPGDEPHRILMELAKDELTAKYILNTHGHFDHVGGNAKLKEVTGAELMIHEADAPMLTQLSNMARMWGMRVENSPPPDRFLTEGMEITFGDCTLKVLHTPGHSPGGVTFLSPAGVFAGDLLFAGSIGRTDFPGGSHETLIRSVKEKLFVLPDDTKVYPGHGPATTVGREKRYNPFFG
ncbi:MAG: MBL fold metallo-hydrolase [Deltaproteobacteria bacterium]|nr:MBL fold metallo-hydrolase [Deltaproteobacteria bacterium]